MLGLVRPHGLDPEHRQIYRYYYCGLCWQLREEYGPLGRLILNYETLFVALLIDAQRGEDVVVRHARCPVHPITGRDHLAPGRLSLKTAAALSALMVEFKLLDDMQDDELGRGGIHRLFGRSFASARRWLEAHRFDVASLEEQFRRLRDCEEEACAGGGTATTAELVERLAQPTANGLATVLVYTAELAHLPQNRLPLMKLGRYLGMAIYLLDNVMDYRKDLRKGRFNPLAVSHSSSTSPRVMDVMAEQSTDLDYMFRHCMLALREAGSTLIFRSHEDLMRQMLSEGIPRTLQAHYQLAQEGYFDVPFYTRLLRRTRSRSQRHTGGDQERLSSVGEEVPSGSAPPE